MDTDQILTAGNGSTCKGKRAKREPWPHECPECGKEFMAACYSRVLCPECKKKARAAASAKYEASEKGKEKKRANARRYRQRHLERAKEAVRKYREANREEICRKQREKYWADPEPHRLKSKLRQRRMKGDGKAAFELRRLSGKVQTCPRLHVSMVQLPCGQRPECWTGKPCEKVAGMSKPKIPDYLMWGF